MVHEASIIDLLAYHPGSSTGDLAKGLNLNPGTVSARLTQLAKAGEIKRASHGYSTHETARPRTQHRQLLRPRLSQAGTFRGDSRTAGGAQ